MTRPPVRIVTVSREFGAGGGDFAARLGERLGWPVLDHEILHRVAERLRMDDDTVARFDEHPPGLLARIASVLVIPQPEVYEFPPVEGVPDHDTIARATAAAILAAAAAPPLVVVGHGSQCLLAGRPDTLHVFLHAPVAPRVARLAQRLRVNAVAAPQLMRHADRERGEYVRRYHHRDWRDPSLYDLQFGTGTIPVADAVAIVEQLVRGREAGATAPSAPAPDGAELS